MKIPFEKKRWQWITIAFLAILWGSSFILMKRGLMHFTNWEVAAYRIFIAFAVLFPFAAKQLKVLKGRYFVPLLLVGLFGNFIPAYLFTKAQTALPSALAGILNSLVPLFTLILGLLFFKMKVKWINVVGVFIGLLGATGLILSNGLEGLGVNFGYGIYVVVATVCYAIAVNIIKQYLHELDATTLTALAFTLVGPIAGIHLLTSDFFQKVTAAPGALEGLLYITVLGVFGTGLAVAIFNMLIKHTTTLFATTVTYLIPVVAMFWGIFDREPVGIKQFLCVAVILSGVYLVNKRHAEKSK